MIVISLLLYSLYLSYGKKKKRSICLHVTLMMDVLNMYLHPMAHIFLIGTHINCTYIGVQIKLEAHSLDEQTYSKQSRLCHITLFNLVIDFCEPGQAE